MGSSVYQDQRRRPDFPDLRVTCSIDGEVISIEHFDGDELTTAGGRTHVFIGPYVSESERRLFRFAAPVSGLSIILRFLLTDV
jgi:hypothetical protein